MSKNFDSLSGLSEEELRRLSRSSWQCCKRARNAKDFIDNVGIHNSLCDEHDKRLFHKMQVHKSFMPSREEINGFINSSAAALADSTCTTNSFLENNQLSSSSSSEGPKRFEIKIRIWCALGATVVGVCLSGAILYKKIFKSRWQKKSV